MEKTCLILVGATAVGKTSQAINIAQHLNTQIISADSRQCFTELNIGVAKPTTEQLNLIPHYFINSHSIPQNINAAVFEQYALQKVEEIFEHNSIAVMVGGTGLYIKAFCEGIDEIPSIPSEVREEIISNYEKFGIEKLQQQIKEVDTEYYHKGEIKNPQRLMRALEIKLHTGNSILSYQQKNKKNSPFKIIKIGLDLPREILYERINTRVDEMMEQGLVQEVEKLLPYKNLNALQTVGYKELFDYFEDKISLPKAIDLIKQNTRHYAKRQLTWFKKDESIIWVDNQNEEAALQKIIKILPE